MEPTQKLTTERICLPSEKTTRDMGHTRRNLMMGNKEKRAHTRQCYAVPIEISYINKEKILGGQSINHCEDGMCFESISSFYPGIDVLWRDRVKFKKLCPSVFVEERFARRDKKQTTAFYASGGGWFILLLRSGFNENVGFFFRWRV